MCPNRNLLSRNKVFKGVVMTSNDTSCPITSIVRVRIKMFDRIVRTLDDIRHVPKLKRNLISLSTFIRKGASTLGCGNIKISKCTRVVLQGQRMSQLYVLQGHTVSLEIN